MKITKNLNIQTNKSKNVKKKVKQGLEELIGHDR